MLTRHIRELVNDPRPLDTVVAAASPATRAILERALCAHELSVAEGVHLLGVTGADLAALVKTADHVRACDAGNEVTYVINRNINWTNICFVGCQFCAFARLRNDQEAYNHDADYVLDKVQDALARGATEICMQGGINPEMDAFEYRDMLVAIKARFPQIHIHAYSPMEIMYGARRTGMSYNDYIRMLRDAGLGTIPGTAAEILDDQVREVLSHKKVSVSTWREIITTAHRLGVRTSSTLMYGHIEQPEHVARHLELIRSIQKETGGFTEFVPLRFIHTYTKLYQKGLVNPPPKGAVDLRMYACARLLLRGAIDNIQTSWVKLGTELAQLTLAAGCNDFGGTLMEESISRLAGADAGEYLPVGEIRALIAGMGRIPVQRTTTYGRLEATGAGESNGRQETSDRAGWRSGRGALAAGPALPS
ncbi:MAG: 5-amino-6-(D-ribitylamino)uracil--L-tyrosine 4-hydroxyphenyl transferase CofH [Deltaproteobacteria bacterium]|nr:5-amino-6-(D-ribitylamino)uracil--L-tyrosine 4-hydroxyphenyl transferase CofH [Deltaproteobacteria bacterium]